MEETILDKWFAQTAQSYPCETTRFLATESDPFRNPVGSTLKKNLATIVAALLGRDERRDAGTAVEEIVRMRAVQNLTAAQAVGFVFLARPIIRESLPEIDPHLLNSKIDNLALAAFDEYVRCREQLAEIRVHESRRARAVPDAMERARS